MHAPARRSERADLAGRRRRRPLTRAQGHNAAHRVLAVRDGALDGALELLHRRRRRRRQRHGPDANAARQDRKSTR